MITPEGNGMVGHFGKQVSGSAFTVSGWVQPHGSRYVKATCFSRFCFVDIDDMMGSDLRYNYEKPNGRRNIFEEAKNLDILVKYKNEDTCMVPNTAFDVGML